MIKLLCAHTIIKYVCKISLLNSQQSLSKKQKNILGILFSAPVYCTVSEINNDTAASLAQAISDNTPIITCFW